MATVSTNQNLPAGSILPGVGVADGNGGFTAKQGVGQGTPPNSGAAQGAGGISPASVPAYSAAAANGVPLSLAGNVSKAAQQLASSQSTQTTPNAYSASSDETNANTQANDISQGQGTNDTSGYGSGTYQNNQQPLTEDDVYNQLLQQSQGIIDGIQSSYDNEIASNTNQADIQGNEAQQNQNAMAAASGLLGSSSNIEGDNQINSNTQSNIQSANAPIVAQKAQAVASALQTIQSNAQSLYQYQTTQNSAQQATTLANAQDVTKTLAASGVNWSQFQQTPEYQQLVQQLGGDPNYADALYTMNVPVGTVDPNLSKVIGNTYYQVTKNPVTGALSSSQFTLPYTPPENWTAQKVSTTTLLEQDPNDPSNTLIYTTDPISGQVNVTGTGTGAALAAEYNSQNTSSASSTSTSSTSPATGAVATDYINTVASTAGISDPTQPFSTVVNGDGTNPGVGIGAIVGGVIKAEGSESGASLNNPGDVKYVPGMANATDSGIAASDGGTWAKFDSPEDGQAAIADTLTQIAQGQGAGATVQSVLDTYANLGSSNNNNQTNASNSQYGLLSNVSGFDPGTPGSPANRSQAIDQFAFNYLQSYLGGNAPTSSSGMGGATTLAEKQEIQSRAEQLYKQATGKDLPTQSELKANLGFINNNQSLLVNLQNQEGTIQANSDLLQANVTAANINDNAPAINSVIDNFQSFWQGNPDIASYVGQTATLQNELGSLLALKNAQGTTVHDKLESAGLIKPNYTAAQEAQVVNTLMQEAQNGRAAIMTSSAKLYEQTDPLQIDPSNPLNDPQSFAESVGINLQAIQQKYPDMTAAQIVQSYVDSH